MHKFIRLAAAAGGVLMIVIALATPLAVSRAADYGDIFRARFYQIKKSVPPPAPLPPAARSAALHVPILVYHSVMPHHPGQTPVQVRFDVDPQVFEQQLRYLKDNGYEVINMEKLIDALANGATLPAKPVVINFDDGWFNQYRYALPILSREGVTATFFLYTKALGHRKFMNWDQVKDLLAKGMSVGGHTRSHPLLTAITDPARLRDEIAGGKQALEDKLGIKVDLFAYPFGASDAAVLAAVKEAGFRAARTDGGGSWNGKSDLFLLRAVNITDDMAAFKKALED